VQKFCVVTISSVAGLESPECSRKLWFPWFRDNGTGWWWGCQPYTPAAFSHRKLFWYSFLL